MRSPRKSWIFKKNIFFFITACLINTCSCKIFSQKPKLILPFGHNDKILTAEFSPDGKRFITGSADQTAKLWDTESNKILANFTGHDYKVSIALFSPDGKYIVTAGGLKAFVWDASSGKLARELKNIDGFISTLKISSDSKNIIIGLNNGKILIYDFQKDLLKKTLFGFREKDVEIPNLDKQLQGIIKEMDLTIKSTKDPKEKKELEEEKKEMIAEFEKIKKDAFMPSALKPLAFLEVSCIAFSNDNTLFLTSVNEVIKIWRLKDLSLLKEIKRPGGLDLICEFDQTNLNILAYSKGAFLDTWNTKTGNKVFSYDNSIMYKMIYSCYLKNGNLLTVFENGNAKLYNAKTGKKIKEFSLLSTNGNISIVKTLNFDKEILTTHTNGAITKWDIETGRKLMDYLGNEHEIDALNLSKDNSKLIISSTDKSFKTWDIKNGNLLSDNKNDLIKINSAFFSEDDKSIIVNQQNQTINIWNPFTGENIRNIKHKETDIEFARMSYDNKMIILSLNSGIFKELNDIGQIKLVDEKAQIKYSQQFGYRNEDYQLIEKKYPTSDKKKSGIEKLQILMESENITLKSNIRISPSTVLPALKTIAFYADDDEDNDNTRKRNEINIEEDGIFPFVKFSPDGEKILVASSEMSSFLYNSNDTRNLIKELEGHENAVNYVDFSKNGKLALTASHDGTAKIWDLGYGNSLPITLAGHLSKIYSVQFNKDETKLITASEDNTFKIWNAKQGKELASFFSLDDQKLFTYLPSGYYSGSPTNVKKLHYVTDKLDIISFDQLDVRFNRPDKVLEALESDNTELIKAYKKAYLKRIIKLGIDTTTFQNEIYVPELNIVDVDKISKNQSNEKITLRIVAKDAKSKINNLNIKINEVPFFGLKGLKIDNRTSIDTTLSINLMYGENRIEAYVRNSNGLESYKKPLTLFFNPIQIPKEKVYFIGLGIDQFKDKSNNLSYSVNDIRALSTVLRKKFGENLEIDTLINQSLNIDNLKKIKQKLLKSNINDKVIIAYSGHGMTDINKDYFLSTYSMNFNNPSDGGLKYEEIENLIDGIPARKKLVLLDACQSGEIDKGNKVQEPILELGDKKNKGKKKSAKGPKPETNTKTNETGLLNSFELMQNLFVNLGNNTGANVLTASKGDKSAYENPSLKHGVFTYFVLDAIKKNESLKISELKNWVFEKVSIESKKSQIPSSRCETILFDWNLW